MSAQNPQPLAASLPAGPLHVGIIMDGNGRWAKKRGLPRVFGHQAGMAALQRTLEAARTLPIGTLTLYSFSAENWRRDAAEVNDLMQLLRDYLGRDLQKLHEAGVRLRVIGDLARLPVDVQQKIADALALTAANAGLTLVIALSYGSRQELVRATQTIAAQVAAGQLAVSAIDENTIEAALDTAGLPAPDLIIRTSGEQRLSNFLLWQAAYAEFYFTETLWPDFGATELKAALADYANRERRFGARLPNSADSSKAS